MLPGPIEKAPRCPYCELDGSIDWVAGLVTKFPEEPGRDSSTFVVVGDVPEVPGGDI